MALYLMSKMVDTIPHNKTCSSLQYGSVFYCGHGGHNPPRQNMQLNLPSSPLSITTSCPNTMIFGSHRVVPMIMAHVPNTVATNTVATKDR